MLSNPGEPSLAEQYVLTTLLQPSDGSSLLDSYRLHLRDAWFSDPRHRAIWRALCALRDAGSPVTVENLVLDASVDGLYAKILSADYLTPSVTEWCRELAESYVRRETAVALEIARERLDAHSWLSTRLAEIAQVASLPGSDAVQVVLPRALADLGPKAHGVRTGIPSLDKVTGGLRRKRLVVVGGRPGHGKTSLALNVAAHAAVIEKAKVLVFSYEMSSEELTLRLLASLADVDARALEERRLSADEVRRVEKVAKRLAAANLEIDDSASADAKAICARIAASKPDLVVVDYLQILPTYARAENRHLELAAVTKALKRAAMVNDVAVVLLSQLSRENTKRKDRKPQLSDLRESGAIESDADVVLFVHREEAYDPEDYAEQGYADLLIRKQRNGPLAELRVAFVGATTTFCDLAA